MTRHREWVAVSAILASVVGCSESSSTTPDGSTAPDGGAVFDSGSDTTVPDAGNPHVTGADCASCHDVEQKNWSTGLHAASASEVLLNAKHNTTELLTDECLGCHSPFQAAKFHIGDFVQPIDQVGPWHLVDANAKAWQANKCEVCHDPASAAPRKLAFWDVKAQAYASVKDSTELCEKCHQAGTDDSRDLKGSLHDGKQCADCHLQTGARMNLSPQAACAKCHPAVDPPGHPVVTTLDTTYKSTTSTNNIHFITCSSCHVTDAGPG